MTGGYTFSVLPDLTLTPSIGAIGEVHGDGTYHVSPLAALGATWSTSAVIVQAQARVAPWSSQPWSASLLGYSRQAVPFGVSGSATASPDGYTASASFTETPSDRLTLSQQVDYASDGTIGTQFGVQLDLARQPVQLVAVATSTASPGSWTASASFTANITQLPWARHGQYQRRTCRFGRLRPELHRTGFRRRRLHLRPTVEHLRTARGSGPPTPRRATASALVPATTPPTETSASPVPWVSRPPTPALQTSAGYDRLKGFTWSVGAQATLFGGFAVPTPVVNAFGGLDVGTVTGILIPEDHQGVVGRQPASRWEWHASAGTSRRTPRDATRSRSLQATTSSLSPTFPPNTRSPATRRSQCGGRPPSAGISP